MNHLCVTISRKTDSGWILILMNHLILMTLEKHFNFSQYRNKDLPFPVLGSSVHISLTPSKTMLQCLSNAFTLPSSFLLFLQLMRTWVLFFTLSVRTLRGPVWNSSCSLASLSSGVMSDFEAIMLEYRSEIPQIYNRSLRNQIKRFHFHKCVNKMHSWLGLAAESAASTSYTTNQNQQTMNGRSSSENNC